MTSIPGGPSTIPQPQTSGSSPASKKDQDKAMAASMPDVTTIDYASVAQPIAENDYDSFPELRTKMSKTPLAALAILAFLAIAGQLASGAIVGATVTAGIAAGIFLLARALSRRKRTAVKLRRFALANGFMFTSLIENYSHQYLGALFSQGYDRRTVAILQGTYKSRPFWLGTHWFTVRAGKHEKDIAYGVMAVTLPRAVPRVLLDRRRNFMTFAGEVDDSQRLRLEGNFNDYFDVYCPPGYERDALYFLTPELMQMLIDMDNSFDVEIVGNVLYFYSQQHVKPDQKILEKFFAVLEHIGGEFAENTSRYQDHRIDKAAGSVAPQGLALKQVGGLWIAIGVIVVLLVPVLIAFVWAHFAG